VTTKDNMIRRELF